MECLFSLLASCLLSNVYVTTEVQANVTTTPWQGYWCGNEWCRGPIGVVRLGTTLDLTPRMRMDFGAMHSSFISTSNDHGRESLYLSVTWHPFRK